MNNTLKKTISLASRSNDSIKNRIKNIFSKRQVNVNEVNVNELQYYNYDDHLFSVDVDNELDYNLSINNINNINKFFSKLVDKNNFIKKFLQSEEIKSVEDFSSILNEYLRITNFDKNTTIALHTTNPVFLYHEEFPEFVLQDVNTLPYYYKSALIDFVNYKRNITEDFINSDENIKQLVDIFLYKRDPNSDIEPHISLNTFMRSPLDKTKVISIDSIYPINLDLITNKLPREVNGYINFLNDEMSSFLNSIEIDDIITLEYGNYTDINNLKILSSSIYPEWEGKYISEITINGSNEEPNKLFQFLLSELNSKFGSLEENELTISLIDIKDDKYLFYNKLIPDGENKLILYCKFFEISNITAPINKVIGDSQFNGNILVGKSNNDYMIKTNNTTNTTLINSKVGINQKEYEMSALLDIDNLTNEQLINLINDFAPNLMNSYFLSNKFKHILCDNYTINDTEIIEAFYNNAEIQSFKEQCYVIKCKVLPELDPSHIKILNSPLKDPLLLNNSSPNFMKLLQRNIREVLQMRKEIQNNNNQDETFSYMELFTNNELSNFLLSMKCNLHSIDEVLITITFQNIDYIMDDPSYNGTATTFFNYISSFTRFANYCTLLVKNVELQNVFFEGDSVNSFSKAIDNNPYFSDRLGLLNDNDFFLYETFGDRKFVFVESVPMWNSITTNYFWNKEVSMREITSKIDSFYDINYGNEKMNQWFPITYKFNGKREISIIYRTEINGKIYTFGSGDEINRIITKGVKVRSDVVIDGDLNINDANNNTIFKVDNIDKKITNAYKVGIGMDYPKSILDIQDLTLNEYKKFTEKSVEHRYEINRLSNILKNNKSLSPSIMTNIINSELINQSPESYYVLMKVNLQSLIAESTTLIYHYLFPEMIGKNMDTIKANLRTVLTLHLSNVNKMLNETALFDGSSGSLVGNGVAGPKKYRYKFFTIEGEMFLLVSGLNFNEYNYRYNTNENSLLLSNASTVMVLAANNILARLSHDNTKEIINYQEETSVLNKLKRKTQEIQFNFNYIQIDLNNITKSRVGTFNYDNLTIQDDVISVEQLNDNNSFKIIRLLSTLQGKSIREKNLYSTTYEDKTNMHVCSYIPVSIDNNSMTIYTVEFSPTKILIPTLNVVGDCNIVGNSTITNENTLEKYIEMDPHKKTFMVNTTKEYINYGNIEYSTTNEVYGTKHNMIVSNDKYPNFVCERVAENNNNNDNKELFSTYTSATMKRKSNLYSLQEMKEGSDLQMKNYTGSDYYKPKYGPDISFEVEDKTNNTVEIGQIAMTIDDLDESGNNIKGGFGVYTNTNNGDGNFESSRKTILYVDNEGTLEVNKIKLGNKVLSVDENGNIKVD